MQLFPIRRLLTRAYRHCLHPPKWPNVSASRFLQITRGSTRPTIPPHHRGDPSRKPVLRPEAVYAQSRRGVTRVLREQDCLRRPRVGPAGGLTYPGFAGRNPSQILFPSPQVSNCNLGLQIAVLDPNSLTAGLVICPTNGLRGHVALDSTPTNPPPSFFHV